MSSDRRKNNFKSTGSVESRVDRSIKEKSSESKSKRDAALAAKRMRLVDSADDILPDPSSYTVRDAVVKIQSDDMNYVVLGLKELKAILSVPDILEDSVVDDIVVILTQHLQSFEVVAVEAAWCLANIACGSHEQTVRLLAVVPQIVLLLQGESDSLVLKEQLMWIVGNIAGDSEECRQALLAQGCLNCLLSCLMQFDAASYLPGLKISVWAVSNLARGSTPAALFTSSGSLPFLVSLLHHSDPAVVSDAAWLFAFLTAKNNEDDHISAMIGQPSGGLWAELLTAGSRQTDSFVFNSTAVPLLRCVNNLLCGPVEWLSTRLLVDGSAVNLLCVLLIRSTSSENSSSGSRESSAVCKEALAVLTVLLRRTGSNSSSGGDTGLMEMVRRAVLEREDCALVRNLQPALCSPRYDVQCEALGALAAALSDPQVALWWVRQHATSVVHPVLTSVADLLKSSCSDCEVVADCISVLRAVCRHSLCINGGCSASPTVDYLLSLDVTETLDNLQYSSGEGGSGTIGREARDLVEQLYAYMEQTENGNNEDNE